MIVLAHSNKLIRQQHVQFLLSDLITLTEIGFALAKHASQLQTDQNAEAGKICTISRLFAAEVAHNIITKGLNIILGTDLIAAEKIDKFKNKLLNSNLLLASQNNIKDMDHIIDLI